MTDELVNTRGTLMVCRYLRVPFQSLRSPASSSSMFCEGITASKSSKSTKPDEQKHVRTKSRVSGAISPQMSQEDEK
jgi:hypothetical protein